MFTKILIANRGEIACRVIQTAKKMGIATVAVYSDVDRDSLHVNLADEAVHIGAAPSRESYLCVDQVIGAALMTGAEAIHPGYGFLSENSEFCRACEHNNIVFLGPPVAAIEAMGSKSAAKRIMETAGVPLVPGYHGDDQSDEILKASALEMGFPVLLKAVAGGGGKGMRQVWEASEFDQALAAARREAMAGFGNDDMLVEKYLAQPRHVEIQVFCDAQGGGVYLFERDCSIQRRHQKVIEEAPAPGLNDTLRTTMGEAALRAARAIGYVGAGTVEFLLDVDGSFYFMEMNTRLQVEHPVTEMITGQDLVEWQLRVGAGESLPLQQQELALSGHAFEARIYAEDPDNDFLPVSGPLTFYQPPHESRHVRVDSGVREGDKVTIFYDPMIAKLIVWGENRDTALSYLASALRQFHIGGLKTNIDFLCAIAESSAFKEAKLDTGFIERNSEEIYRKADNGRELRAPLVALYLLLVQVKKAAAEKNSSLDFSSPWHGSLNWRLNQANSQQFNLVVDGEELTLTAEHLEGAEQPMFKVGCHGVSYELRGRLIGHTLVANIDGFQQQVSVSQNLGVGTVFTSTGSFQFEIQQPDTGEADTGFGDESLLAPMHGTIVSLLVESGAVVDKGQPLMIMEAMKMEHTIRAPKDGSLVEFYFQAGDLVAGGDQLLNFVATE